MTVSAYILVYNQASYLKEVIQSIINQTVPVQEILIIDDGSDTPLSYDLLTLNDSISIVRNPINCGRGYGRNLATNSLNGSLILSVDATNTIESSFVEKAIQYFHDPLVAAVYGRLHSYSYSGVINRWRARHLFKEFQDVGESGETDMLITYGTLMRKSSCIKAGGYDPSLKYDEDIELGKRILASGHKIMGINSLKLLSISKESVYSLFERYARWYMDTVEKPSVKGYLHNIKASINPMVFDDLKKKDIPSAFLSLLCPHFQLYFSIKMFLSRKIRRGNKI